MTSRIPWLWEPIEKDQLSPNTLTWKGYMRIEFERIYILFIHTVGGAYYVMQIMEHFAK